MRSPEVEEYIGEQVMPSPEVEEYVGELVTLQRMLPAVHSRRALRWIHDGGSNGHMMVDLDPNGHMVWRMGSKCRKSEGSKSEQVSALTALEAYCTVCTWSPLQ
jgi:hypothetical protein